MVVDAARPHARRQALPENGRSTCRFRVSSFDALTSEPSLKGYHLRPSVRGDLLAKFGRFDEARAEFERAAELTRNARERALLLELAAACARGSAPP
jgi:predicted RNA polymerase sigma factor